MNNAGLSRGLKKLYLDAIQDWEEMIDTNVKGLLYVTRAVVPGMVERGSGHVINLGSIAGHMAYRERRCVLRDEGCGAVHQRRAEDRPEWNAGARDIGRSRNGEDGLQPGAVPRQRGARGEDV